MALFSAMYWGCASLKARTLSHNVRTEAMISCAVIVNPEATQYPLPVVWETHTVDLAFILHQTEWVELNIAMEDHIWLDSPIVPVGLQQLVLEEELELSSEKI